MHIDENKKFDKRNVEKNIKSRIITQKDYENYLSKLPDVSDKLFIFGENLTDSTALPSKGENQISSKKKGQKMKKRGKGM
jgi:hypothetical protein